MATRTRKATASSPPAKKTAAKKTARSPRKTAKAAPPSLALVKTDPTPDDTVVDTRTPLTARRRLFVGPMGASEQAAVRAALAAAHNRLPIPVRAWNGSTANLTDGTLLIHNPGDDRTFTAHIACRHGAVHGWPITTHQDLREARALTHACERRHATNTTGDNGIEYDWTKAVQHGIQPTTRLGEGLKTAKKATADTQSLNTDDIAAGLAARAIDTEQPKEHPNHA
jgi:hypothetical protein